MKSNHSNGIWDEHQWESHINEIEKNSNQFKSILDNRLGEDNPRWFRILKESESERDALDSYIEEELNFEESYYPDDEDDWDLDDEPDDDVFFELDDDMELSDGDTSGLPFLDLDDDLDDDEDDLDDLDDLDEDDLLDEYADLEEGEEWKLLSEEYAMTNSGSLDSLAVYNAAHKLGTDLLKLSDNRPEVLENLTYNAFVSMVLHISTKITAGYTYGFAKDLIGANIAYSKKGLYAANDALELLQALKSQSVFVSREEYQKLHTTLFEVRNELGIYIQELRERFRGE